MPSRFTPAALASTVDIDRDEESTFERIRHVRHDPRKHSIRKRRLTERIQQQNAQARRSA